MQTKANHNIQDQAVKRATWYKIVEDFNASGQSQINYCKQNNINKDHFAYYISCWRKDKSASSAASQFIPMEIVKTTAHGKLILNIASGINLELPEDISMQQLSKLLLSLRTGLCS